MHSGSITSASSLKKPPQLPSPLMPFRLAHWPADSPHVWVKRDDTIHPVISGNKWRKLSGLDLSPHSHIVSIGGGYSNHLHALAFLCHSLNKRFTALVRGNYSSNLTPMLKDIQAWGGDIQYQSRQQYSSRDSVEFHSWLKSTHGDAYWVPEGGSTQDALKGIAVMMEEIDMELVCPPDVLIAPVASGATLAGMITHAQSKQNIIGIAVLKGNDYLCHQVERFLTQPHSYWSINSDFTFGGYAKRNTVLDDFCKYVCEETQVPLEPVYSGKAFYALDKLICRGAFNPSQHVVIIHTGGLQGAR